MTNKKPLQTGGRYEIPSCEFLDLSIDGSILTESLTSEGIENYITDDGTIDL